MTQTTKTISVEPGSAIDHLLEEAAETPVELEKGGVRYRLTRVGPLPPHPDVRLADEGNIWAGYSPGQAREALHRSAGALRGVDRDQLLTDLAQQRAQDSHGRPA